MSGSLKINLSPKVVKITLFFENYKLFSKLNLISVWLNLFVPQPEMSSSLAYWFLRRAKLQWGGTKRKADTLEGPTGFPCNHTRSLLCSPTRTLQGCSTCKKTKLRFHRSDLKPKYRNKKQVFIHILKVLKYFSQLNE